MRHQRPPSYTSNRGPDWSGSSPAGNRLKSQSSSTGGGGSGSSNNVTSPNPYAPSFVSSSSSPWTTPSGSSSNSRYKPRGSNSSNAARTLFPGSSSGGEDKYFHKSSSSNWDDHASESGSSLGGSELNGGDESSSLLRSNQPVHENWESYADGQTSSHASTLPSQANTEPASLNLTPADSPSLVPFRSGDLGDKLVLDERGTDISLSTLKKEGLSGDISIHMLSLLYDPPVQGCELKPYVSVVDGNNRVTAVTSDDHGLDFRWFRGQKRICSNTTGNCNKAATIQCVSCAKLSANLIPQHLTYFCSEKCLKENWQQHKQLHMQQHVQKREPSHWSFDEEESDETVRPESPSHLHCKYPSVLANTWQETSTERSYVPSVEDVGRSMRLECAPVLKTAQQKEKREKELEAAKARGEAAPLGSTSQLNSNLTLGSIVRIDTGAVIPTPQPPPPRTLLYTDPSNPVNASNTFRTVCYNVLAQIYATRQVYPYTAIWALAWEYRKNLLLREIVSHNADIICLQEVQSNHFYSFFQPELAAHGYEGTFKNKTRDAGSDSGGNQVIDGCATFFKRDRFALMEQYGIEFNEAARQQTSNRQQLRRLLKGNIALVLVLEELTPPPSSNNSSAARRNRKRRLCITNTHIFWDPEFPEVKLWQTWILCQELEKLVLPRNLPLLLCGDFNSLVDSSVYELLSTERVEPGEDVFGSTGDPTHLLPAPHSVTHRLPLLSAYGSTLGEPKYTNYTGSFVGILDYIFFTRTHLRCVACLDVDDESLLRQHTALPSPHYSSDHLPLVTILEFLDA